MKQLFDDSYLDLDRSIAARYNEKALEKQAARLIALPGGTVVAVYQLPAFTLPNNFTVLGSFLPKRWLLEDYADFPIATDNDRKKVFQLFSVGPKACLGKGLAYAEIKLIIARLVWHFDFELVNDGFAFEKQRAFLFRERLPLNVRLSVRSY
ncbi:cytochrome P450 [Massariosphaeria phaeospora]|uniref:Cytochrome P450 n=1 Tax=Massariosphaeria phaeospora TaxID=100035 RepID=A0A7C8M3K3_9PLEO|nr:cytochrome P450 [Massariosphaeria phaeospora]